MKHPFKLDGFMIQAFYNFREPFWECPPNLWFCYPYTNQQCLTGRSSCGEKEHGTALKPTAFLEVVYARMKTLSAIKWLILIMVLISSADTVVTPTAM